MKIEVIDGKRKATPTNENDWLCNESIQVITDYIWLGVNDDGSNWVDVTAEEKEALEKEWEEEMNAETV